MIDKLIIYSTANVLLIGKIKDFLTEIKNFVLNIGDFFENFNLYFSVLLLSICMIVGTVALFLRIIGFKTTKWAVLAAATFLFIILML